VEGNLLPTMRKCGGEAVSLNRGTRLRSKCALRGSACKPTAADEESHHHKSGTVHPAFVLMRFLALLGMTMPQSKHYSVILRHIVPKNRTPTKSGTVHLASVLMRFLALLGMTMTQSKQKTKPPLFCGGI